MLLACETQEHGKQDRQFEQQADATPLDAVPEPGGEHLQPGYIHRGIFHGSSFRISNVESQLDCSRSASRLEVS
jgi:hypothetical protein